MLWHASEAQLWTACGSYAPIVGQRTLQVHCVLFGEGFANAIVKLVILLSSVEWQLVGVDNIHNIDLVIILSFALEEIIAVAGNQLHPVSVVFLHQSSHPMKQAEG